jgi:hypothetical protein
MRHIREPRNGKRGCAQVLAEAHGDCLSKHQKQNRQGRDDPDFWGEGCVVASARQTGSCDASAFAARSGLALDPAYNPRSTFFRAVDKNAIAHSTLTSHPSFFSFLFPKANWSHLSDFLPTCARVVHRVVLRSLNRAATIFSPVKLFGLHVLGARTAKYNVVNVLGTGRYTSALFDFPRSLPPGPLLVDICDRGPRSAALCMRHHGTCVSNPPAANPFPRCIRFLLKQHRRPSRAVRGCPSD